MRRGHCTSLSIIIPCCPLRLTVTIMNFIWEFNLQDVLNSIEEEETFSFLFSSLSSFKHSAFTRHSASFRHPYVMGMRTDATKHHSLDGSKAGRRAPAVRQRVYKAEERGTKEERAIDSDSEMKLYLQPRSVIVVSNEVTY